MAAACFGCYRWLSKRARNVALSSPSREVGPQQLVGLVERAAPDAASGGGLSPGAHAAAGSEQQQQSPPPVSAEQLIVHALALVNASPLAIREARGIAQTLDNPGLQQVLWALDVCVMVPSDGPRQHLIWPTVG